MEDNNYTQEMIQILEEIQINSYNLNQEFIKMNEQFLKINDEILQSESTTGAAIKTNNIHSIAQSNSILVVLFIIYLTFSLIKMRGERMF